MLWLVILAASLAGIPANVNHPAIGVFIDFDAVPSSRSVEEMKKEAAKLMKTAKQTADQVAGGLKGAYGATADGVAKALKGAGYAANEVAGGLKTRKVSIEFLNRATRISGT